MAYEPARKLLALYGNIFETRNSNYQLSKPGQVNCLLLEKLSAEAIFKVSGKIKLIFSPFT